jgi:monooxygenase
MATCNPLRRWPDGLESLDVIVVGAGVSGIAAGHYLQADCPGRSYAILESRQAIGGTWDLFRYPGVRSDSDMFTLGYSFRPWQGDGRFASGPAIREYVTETAKAEGIDRHIRYGHRVTGADWNSGKSRWIVTVAGPAGEHPIECRFLFFCSGYYDYERGHEVEWPGAGSFTGRIVHPQHWPAGLDFAGKRVVVIGSGATAVTLLPEMARTAQHVTMLQRSPSYIVAMPSRDRIGAVLRRLLPLRASHAAIRWKNILMATLIYQLSRRRPELVKRLIRQQAVRLLGPDFDVDRHLSPRYDPWDQRLCIAPSADFFRAVRSGKASIVTDRIECFTPSGIRLASGEELPADVIVTATGLKLKLMGGAPISIDGVRMASSRSVVYRGSMYSGVPNLAVASGYTNASWTLKCELTARFVCRVLNEMQRRSNDTCVPELRPGEDALTEPFLNLTSGYIQRDAAMLPRQGVRSPWRMHQNYLLDLLTLKYARLRDGALRFW